MSGMAGDPTVAIASARSVLGTSGGGGGGGRFMEVTSAMTWCCSLTASNTGDLYLPRSCLIVSVQNSLAPDSVCAQLIAGCTAYKAVWDLNCPQQRCPGRVAVKEQLCQAIPEKGL